jgi:hypothetical protein
LKGRVFYAQDVIGSLIDSIGPFETAVDRVLELANFKEDPGTGNSNNSNKQKRQMKQFTHLNGALNVESLESSEEGVFLQEEQLQTIETALEANQQIVSERDTAIQERDSANQSLQTVQAELASAYDPLNAIDPTIASAETTEAKVSAIRTLLAAKPAVAPVQTLGQQDNNVTAEEDWEMINNLPHNKQVDQNS